MLCSETSVQLSTSEVNSGNLFSFSNIPVAKKICCLYSLSTSKLQQVLQCPCCSAPSLWLDLEL